MVSDRNVYEAHRVTIQAHNDLITSLGPGASVSPANFALSPGMGTGAKILGTSGTFKRGTVTFQIGTAALGANPTITLGFPKGTFSTVPFGQVVRNGGSGALAFTYSESLFSLTITLGGTPAASTTYTIQFSMQD